MINLKYLIFLIAICSARPGYSQTKKLIHKDTLYYSLDTAKIPLKDRIIEIIPYPGSHSFYTYLIRTGCLIYQSDPNLMSIRNDPGKILSEQAVNKLPFISITDLNRMLCKEQVQFKTNHKLFFIEHMPNGSYLKREIILGAFENETDDHVLKKQ